MSIVNDLSPTEDVDVIERVIIPSPELFTNKVMAGGKMIRPAAGSSLLLLLQVTSCGARTNTLAPALNRSVEAPSSPLRNAKGSRFLKLVWAVLASTKSLY